MKTIKKYTGAIIAVVIVILIAYVTAGYLLRETKQITPTKTERVQDKYLIFTDKGVYQDTDDWRFFKFNSSDLYAKLSSKLQKPVTVEITGLRIPFFSMYKNIIKIEE